MIKGAVTTGIDATAQGQILRPPGFEADRFALDSGAITELDRSELVIIFPGAVIADHLEVQLGGQVFAGEVTLSVGAWEEGPGGQRRWEGAGSPRNHLEDGPESDRFRESLESRAQWARQSSISRVGGADQEGSITAATQRAPTGETDRASPATHFGVSEQELKGRDVLIDIVPGEKRGSVGLRVENVYVTLVLDDGRTIDRAIPQRFWLTTSEQSGPRVDMEALSRWLDLGDGSRTYWLPWDETLEQIHKHSSADNGERALLGRINDGFEGQQATLAGVADGVSIQADAGGPRAPRPPWLPSRRPAVLRAAEGSWRYWQR